MIRLVILGKQQKKSVTTLVLIGIMLLLFCICPGCAPRQRNAADSSPAAGAQVIGWSASMDCGTCHVTEADNMQNPEMRAAKHTDAACTDCHTADDDLAVAHGDLSVIPTSKTLSKTNSVTEDRCLACHGSWESLVQLTEDSTALTDSNDLTVNPHALERSGNHQIFSCTSCHKAHSPAENPKKPCLSCHHEDVFQCYTCHE